MTAARGPIATISYDKKRGARYVVRVNGHVIPTRVDSHEQIGESWDTLRRAFEKFALQLALAPTKWQDSWEAVCGLTESTTSVVDAIFGHAGAGGFRIENVLNALHPAWRVAAQPVHVTIVADLDQFLPLELLPLFDTSLLPVKGTQQDFHQAVRRFPGFSTVVRRQFPDIPQPAPNADSLLLDNFDLLPLRFFWNDELRGAAAEEKFFRQLHDVAIKLIGPLPLKAQRGRELAGELAKWLWEAQGQYGANARGDQIQHFACHCDSDLANSMRSKLMFSGNNDILIEQLMPHLRALYRPSPAKAGRPVRAGRPLVFLNACRSLQTRPGAQTSLPRFLLDPDEGCGSRGVIGTVAKVPDYFAAPFAERFYRYLLSGAELGDAMYQAKRDLLVGEHNPLGLLYLLYADPRIRVRIANPDVAPRTVAEATGRPDPDGQGGRAQSERPSRPPPGAARPARAGKEGGVKKRSGRRVGGAS